MPEQWFLFVQLEFPWELGPEDGRYLLRGGVEREPEHVVVLSTVGAARRGAGRLASPRRRRGREVPAGSAGTTDRQVAVARATVIDPVPVASERQARAWLEQLDPAHEAERATGVLNRMVLAHRIATADAYAHELSAARALVVRAGWGEGEQVADGAWEQARELPWSPPRRQRRSLALRPQERLTRLLGAREEALLCEELTLRARRDLDQGRLEHATVELRGAYTAALAELEAEPRADMAPRVAELRELASGVADAARVAIPGAAAGEQHPPAGSDEETVRHALERLEAALRARAAGLKLE